MRRPVWIALPFIAVLLGAALYELASAPERPPVSRPATARFEARPEGSAAQPLQSPLDTREVFRRIDEAPRLEPPAVPPLDGDNVRRIEWANGGCRIRYETLRTTCEYDFVATITNVRRDQRTFMCETHAGTYPTDDATFHVYDGDGNQLVECRLLDVNYRLEGDDFENFSEEYLFEPTEIREGLEIRERLTVKPSGEQTWPHGLWQEWHRNGVAACNGSNVMGMRDGDWTWWHDNGTVAAIGSYEEGQRVGTWRLWYEDGARHAVWTADDAGNQFRGWQVWDKDGEPHPCYDPHLRELLDRFAECIREREFANAQEHLSALAAVVRDISAGRSRESMDKAIARVQSNLDRILDAETEDDREGERLLLTYTELAPLQRSFNYFAPEFPD